MRSAKLRRFLHIPVLLVLLGSLLLSACGDSPTTAPSTTAAATSIATTAANVATTSAATTNAATTSVATTSAVTTNAASTTSAANLSGVKLRMITPIFPNNANVNGKQVLEGEILAKFKQETGVSVEVEYLPNYTGYPAKLTTAFAGGLPYDVFNLGLGWVEPFANNLMPLDDLGVDTSDFYEGILDSGKSNGKLLAIPYVIDTRIMVYRKDIFKEVGLDPEKPPTSWDELREYALKLTKRAPDGTLERAGFDVIQAGPPLNESPRAHWFRFLWQNGGELFSADNSKATFNNEQGIEALQYWVDMVRKHKVTDVGFNSGQSGVSLISIGKAAMGTINMQSLSQQVEKNPELRKVIGIIPPINKTKQAEFVGGSYWAIAKNTKNADAARKLVKYLSSKEVILIGNKYRNAIPPLKSLFNDPYVQNDYIIKAGMENLKYARSEGGPSTWLEIRDLFDPALTEAVVGKKTPKEALDEAANKANAILAKGNK
jgi:multiple sugar transport system substrate-binding protein